MTEEPVSNNILFETKHVLGVDHFATEFDIDILMHINTAFFLLNDMGVGEMPPVVTESTEWSEAAPEIDVLPLIKSFVFVVVRLAFDRPETSYGIQALERMRDEWAWRIEMRWREKDAKNTG